MKKVLIVKVGSTFPTLAASHGDFEDWIASPLSGHRKKIEVHDPRMSATLPDSSALAGIIITGSHSMVTDRHDWSERLAGWLPAVVMQEIPLLGICYGHQLLAHAMGGLVTDNPNGREFGTCRIELTLDAADDRLLGEFAPAISANLCHTQSVVALPPGAIRLARSTRDPNQSFRIGRCAWGVQFHPEFDSFAMKTYIRECSALLSSEGEDPAALADGVVDTAAGGNILRRFMEICDQSSLQRKQSTV